MTTEDALVAALRRVAAHYRTAEFSTTYDVIRDWLRVPIDDRPADGAYILAWVTLNQRHCRPVGADWSNHAWQGKEFAGPYEAFAALEALPELRAASCAQPWQVQVIWLRNGEGTDVAVIGRNILMYYTV
jgi:hypothetical protein